MSQWAFTDRALTLLTSLRYVVGLETAQWARRNRVEPPWWATSWIGAALVTPIMVGGGALALGGGVLLSDGVGILSRGSATGEGLVVMAALVFALVGVARSGRLSVATSILQPANRAHLIAVPLHPWTLFVQQVLLAIAPALLRTLLLFSAMVGVGLRSGSAVAGAVGVLLLICLAEVLASLAGMVMSLRRRSSDQPDFGRLVLRETVVVVCLFFIVYAACGRAASILGSTSVSDASIIRTILLLDELGRTNTRAIVALCATMVVAATPLVLRTVSKYGAPEPVPGSFCVVPAGPAPQSVGIRRWEVLGALLSASLRDRKRASTVWRKHALISARIGVAIVAGVTGFEPHLPNAPDAWATAAVSGSVLTLELALLISFLSAQGTALWCGVIRWLVDLGLGVRGGVAGYLGGVFVSSTLPVLPLAFGATLIAGHAGFTWRLVCAMGVVFAGAVLADLLDGAASLEVDGTAEAGVLGGLVSGVILAASTTLLALDSPLSAALLPLALALTVCATWILMTRQLTQRRPSL